MDPAPKRASYADLLALPEGTRAEILDGNLVTTPGPLPEHGWVQRTVGRFIGGPFGDDDNFGGPGGWWILPEVDVELGEHDIVRPDLSGWRRERLPSPWGKRPITVTPDWVCEILSPSSGQRKRVVKANLYAQYRVPFYWLIDPTQCIVEALELRDQVWVRVGAYDASAKADIPPFESVELEVGRLFPPI